MGNCTVASNCNPDSRHDGPCRIQNLNQSQLPSENGAHTSDHLKYFSGQQRPLQSVGSLSPHPHAPESGLNVGVGLQGDLHRVA